MFLEFLNRLLSLDIAWFVWLVTANVFWIFAFFAICFFFWDKDKTKAVAGMMMLSILAWLWVDFEMISGIVLFVGGFLGIYYITKVAVLVFAADMPALRDKLVIVSELQFIVLLIIYNFFIR